MIDIYLGLSMMPAEVASVAIGVAIIPRLLVPIAPIVGKLSVCPASMGTSAKRSKQHEKVSYPIVETDRRGDRYPWG